MPGPAASPSTTGIARWLPGIAQLRDYPSGALRGDLVAGLSVCVVMVPSVLAYAELAGVAPQAGLYAALGAMVAYAAFASSRRVVVGPDTTIALLAGSVVVPLAAGDPARAADLAAVLALLTGALLVVAGRFGLGNVADLLSTPVLVGYANGATYNGAKGAVLAMAKGWAKEFAPWNIRVNIVAPGHTLTPMPLSLDSMDDVARKAQAIPLKRYAEPEEMGYAIAWLLGPESEFVTGQVISPNGGFTIT